jgi:hypothetical protein
MLRTMKARPFRPFSMHLVDGRELEVRHPELIALTAGGRLANLWTGSDDPPEVIDVLIVVSLGPLS